MASGDVRNLINKKGFLNKKMKLSAITQIINGIAYCHEHCIMHRDLKPDNVLYFQNGNNYIFKLTDFGLARSFSRHSGRTYSLNVITRWYRGPELTFKKYDESCDVWSMGVMSSEILFAGNLRYFASPDNDDHFKFLCQTFGFPNGLHWAMANQRIYYKELNKWQKMTKKQDYSGSFEDNCFIRARKMSTNLEYVIRQMLIMDYTKRITMKEALNVLINDM